MILLRTERLLLRPFRDEDAEALVAIHQHDGLRRFIPGQVLEGIEGAPARLARFGRFDDHPVLGIVAIERAVDGAVVGLIMLQPIPASAGVEVDDVEIGWRGHPEHGGRGYVTEAAAVVLDHALESGLPRVVAVTHPDNEPSQAVCRRLGMQDRGTTDEYYDEPALRLFVADGVGSSPLDAQDDTAVDPSLPDDDVRVDLSPDAGVRVDLIGPDDGVGVDLLSSDDGVRAHPFCPDDDVRVDLIGPADRDDLLALERANRAFFARTVGDRGDAYLATFAERHAALVAENHSGESIHLAVRDATGDGRVVGRVSIGPVVDGEALLAYRVAESEQGRGIATRAVARALTRASERGVWRVVAEAAVGNLASRAVLERNGFRLVETDGPIFVGPGDEPAVRYVRDL